MLNSALTHAFEAREKAAQAQEVAMGALNIPSASDIERLTRRVRSVSQRLEGIEDGIDRIDQRAAPAAAQTGTAERLDRIDAQLDALRRELGALRAAIPAGPSPVPREQERLRVGDG